MRPIRVDPGHEEEVVGSGIEADVVAGSVQGQVLKRYRDRAASQGRIKAEADTLRVLSAVDPPPSVRFPRLGSVRPHLGELEMEQAFGQGLDVLGAKAGFPKEIGELLAQGLEHYVNVLGRAYHDLAPDNLIWDAEAGELWFLDVAGTIDIKQPPEGQRLLEHSLGFYLGSVAYDVARPRGPSLRVAARHQLMMAQAWARLVSTQDTLSRGQVIRSAWHQFAACAFVGPVARDLYYGTIGLVKACAVLIGGYAFMARRHQG